VRPTVDGQVAGGFEASPAGKTLKRLLARMTPAVDRQFLRLAEVFAAVSAHELSAVDVHVLPQILLRREGLAAFSTGVRVLAAADVVFCRIQTRFCREVFVGSLWSRPVVMQIIVRFRLCFGT